MKPYGVKRKDQGCCPGHDKFPYESYGSRVSMKLKNDLRTIDINEGN